MRVRDYQKNKAYTWEIEDVFAYEDHRFASKADAFATMAKACADYGIFRIPELRWRSNLTYAYLRGDNSMIVVPESVWYDPATLLHEVAHYIAETHPKHKAKVRNGTMALHSPEWMGIFLDLLSRYANWNWETLAYTAWTHGIEVAEIENLKLKENENEEN